MGGTKEGFTEEVQFELALDGDIYHRDKGSKSLWNSQPKKRHKYVSVFINVNIHI